uniref:Uncharacterized protein n=1 Tax=Scleropages formosus TaxID=113540 RepID=A0A8C9STZ2_SCLFO
MPVHHKAPQAGLKPQTHQRILFHGGKCFAGQKLEVCGECETFRTRRLDLLRPPDFRGQQHILERGDYPDFQLWNAHRPQRPHGLLQARENGEEMRRSAGLNGSQLVQDPPGLHNRTDIVRAAALGPKGCGFESHFQL